MFYLLLVLVSGSQNISQRNICSSHSKMEILWLFQVLCWNWCLSWDVALTTKHAEWEQKEDGLKRKCLVGAMKIKQGWLSPCIRFVHLNKLWRQKFEATCLACCKYNLTLDQACSRLSPRGHFHSAHSFHHTLIMALKLISEICVHSHFSVKCTSKPRRKQKNCYECRMLELFVFCVFPVSPLLVSRWSH